MIEALKRLRFVVHTIQVALEVFGVDLVFSSDIITGVHAEVVEQPVRNLVIRRKSSCREIRVSSRNLLRSVGICSVPRIKVCTCAPTTLCTRLVFTAELQLVKTNLRRRRGREPELVVVEHRIRIETTTWCGEHGCDHFVRSGRAVPVLVRVVVRWNQRRIAQGVYTDGIFNQR